uniref:Translation initiation factor IF-1 n=1 Tax=candidate division WOR-3 bacterium TaxID=2052148 RepID=A0A7C4YSN1_UNCW3
MDKNKGIQVRGKVIEKLPDTKFKVKLELSGEPVVLAYISGKMRMNYIRIEEGDTVIVELSPYDLTKGRIIYREK